MIWIKAAGVLASVVALAAAAQTPQGCVKPDSAVQAQKEKECREAGGQWARFGVRDHLCGVYSCAARTGDGGKECRNHSDCEYLCLAKGEPRVGSPAAGQCAAIRSEFGCKYHVNGGVVAGRVCVD